MLTGYTDVLKNKNRFEFKRMKLSAKSTIFNPPKPCFLYFDGMYKSKLQELCQRRSWSVPEYSTVKDGPDHIPRFKATAVVNGQIFETPVECKSSKDAQNSVAKIAYDYFNIPTSPRVRREQSPSAQSPLVQPLVPACSSPVAPVPEIPAVALVSPLPEIPVPVSPLPSSLPLPPPGLLAPNNRAHAKLVHEDMMQPNFGDMIKTPIGSNGTLHMYKNRLQQYAQKKNLSLPVYTCESEGPPHARHFKSRVSFNGKSYETIESFPTLKDAEQMAAKVACQMLSIDQIQEDGGLYKNLLQEVAQKRGLLCPTYETVKSGPHHRPLFVSIVEIGSSTFHGTEAKSKKQAEMNAATVAYCALLESSPMTECSKVSSSMESDVADNLTQNTLPTETMKRNEFVANEETEINAKRVRCSHENETSNSPAMLPPEVSSIQVEHQAVAGQPIEAERTFCRNNLVYPRKSNFPIPEGASEMPYSNDQWVAYKVELKQEPTA